MKDIEGNDIDFSKWCNCANKEVTYIWNETSQCFVSLCALCGKPNHADDPRSVKRANPARI